MRLSRILEAQPRVLGYGSEETIIFFGCGEDMEGLLDAFVEAKMILDEAGLKVITNHELIGKYLGDFFSEGIEVVVNGMANVLA